MPFDLIYTDPPWEFKSNSKDKPGRNVRKEYETMKIPEMKQFQVDPHGNKNSMMAMWVTGPYIARYPELMEAWGYKPQSTLFTWIKLNKNFDEKFNEAFVDIFSSTNISSILDGGDALDVKKMASLIKKIKIAPEELLELINEVVKMGMGYHTRANAEFCIYGKKGNGIGYLREVKNVKEVIISVPRPMHSAKPLEAYQKLETIYPQATMLEMFARERYSDRWKIWGNHPGLKYDVVIQRQTAISDFF